AKPTELLELSSKGTVPVLYLKDENKIIDESLDIMLWALSQYTGQTWLPASQIIQSQIFHLIHQNDCKFKKWLDKYKYAERHPEHSVEYYFDKASEFLSVLEAIIKNNNNLGGENYNLADMAILP